MRKSEKITALYERLSRDDFGKDDDQQRESNSISNQKARRKAKVRKAAFKNFYDPHPASRCRHDGKFIYKTRKIMESSRNSMNKTTGLCYNNSINRRRRIAHMANKKNRVKITWSDIVNVCARTYEKKQKIKQETTITGSIIGDAILYDAILSRDERDREDRKRRR